MSRDRRVLLSKSPRVGDVVCAPFLNDPDERNRRCAHFNRFTWVLENREGGVFVVQCLRTFDHHRVLAEAAHVDMAYLLRNSLDNILTGCTNPAPHHPPRKVDPKILRKFARQIGLVGIGR